MPYNPDLYAYTNQPRCAVEEKGVFLLLLPVVVADKGGKAKEEGQNCPVSWSPLRLSLEKKAGMGRVNLGRLRGGNESKRVVGWG